mmetsp:Transcript_15306/g.21842  ORF Transcript_15306/g.21842 Transcript_15306/m.21842 type:complete len:593 (-) Transcript_15306:358-2136(-)
MTAKRLSNLASIIVGTSLQDELKKCCASADVIDINFHSSHSNVYIVANYIIEVKSDSFNTFRIKKKFKDLRRLSKKVKIEPFHNEINKESVQYYSKTNLDNVKAKAQRRTKVINKALEALFNYLSDEKSVILEKDMEFIVDFFLTDHIYEDIAPGDMHKNIIPLTVTNQQSPEQKKETEKVFDLKDQMLIDDDDELSTTSSYVENMDVYFGPLVFSLILASFIMLSGKTVTIGCDYLLFAIMMIFAASHATHSIRREKMVDMSDTVTSLQNKSVFEDNTREYSPNRSINSEQNMKESLRAASVMLSSQENNDISILMQSIAELSDDVIMPQLEIIPPLLQYPKESDLGSVFNCWSRPPHQSFRVRGKNYIKDKKKISSEDFLFPTRGVDLFLTDDCPENVGRFTSLFGGELRKVPTMIINFRLPWGFLATYHEIPEKFRPFIQKNYDESQSSSLMDNMSPAEKCVCKFLVCNDEIRTKSFKLVPNVVQGPWIVKNVVGGKPAIPGKKMPIKYFHGSADQASNDAEYFEIDLDIVSSAAARGILAVTRKYTKVLTLDLGFVIEGNNPDELPEQMLLGTRLHGIDPMNAPTFPV